MKSNLLTLILTTILVSIGWLWLIDKNLENVGSYYDILWNSASGHICTSHEPPNAHPEMYFDWSTLEIGTRVVCHGEPIDFKKLLDDNK